MADKVINGLCEWVHYYDFEPTETKREAASCCRGCAYEVRCERDTSWRGRCPDYAEYESNY